MDTQNIRHSLLMELRKPGNQKLFEIAHKRNAAFAGHSTPLSVIVTLDDRSTIDYAEKEALTRSLIAEQQLAPTPLWSAILIAAYLPMLGRLHSRIKGNPFSPDDLDHIVITAFLQVVQEFPLSRWQAFTCARLRQQTQRRVFRELNRERRILNLRDFRSIEEIQGSDFEESSLLQKSNRSNECKDRDVELEIALLLDYVGDAIDPVKLECIIATTIRGESLRDFIRRQYLVPLDVFGDREYQRCKRQRSRTLAIIREILKRKLSPTKGGSCFVKSESKFHPKGG